MDAPSVLISILNWNNASKTMDCIASLESQLKQNVIRTEVCVIDNGSKLDDYHKLESEAKNRNVNLIRQDKNLGFTGGHNISIARAIANEYNTNMFGF
jgi:GT2 family glycosyltransferase